MIKIFPTTILISIDFITCTPQLTTVVTLSTLPNSFAKHRVIRGNHQLSHLPAINVLKIQIDVKTTDLFNSVSFSLLP